MPDVTVSIITYSQVDHAKRCIASVLAGGEEVNLILTANGNPEAAKFFEEVARNTPNVTVVINPTNEGFWKPNNHALTLTNTRWLCLCNDDVIVPRGWLDPLKKPFLVHPNSVFSCPDGGCSALLPDFTGTIGRKEYCEGALLLIDTAIAKKHGLFEPLPGLCYGEDSHSSLRFRQLGYNLHWVPLKITHARGATSKTVPSVRKWQEQNHAYLRQRWSHYLKCRRMDFPIILKRTAAWGDVLLTTPIIEALKRKYPLSPIHVETACGGIFVRNPHVSSVAPRLPRMPDALTFNLDMAYEKRTNVSILQAYTDACGLAAGEWETRTRLYPSDHDHSRAARIMGGSSIDWVSMHIGPSTWRSKEWPIDRFAEVADAIRAMGKKIVLVGAPGKPFAADLDQRGVTTIHEMAAVIGRTHLFIGLDSFPLHVAQAMLTPAIGLFGVTDPQYILPPNPSAIGVCGTTESFGVRHRSPNTTVVDDGGAAMSSITAATVIETIKSFAWVETVA